MIQLSKLTNMKVKEVVFKPIDPVYLTNKIWNWNESFGLGLTFLIPSKEDELQTVQLDDTKFSVKYKAPASDVKAFEKWLTAELTEPTSYSKVRKEVIEFVEETHLIKSISLEN